MATLAGDGSNLIAVAGLVGFVAAFFGGGWLVVRVADRKRKTAPPAAPVPAPPATPATPATPAATVAASAAAPAPPVVHTPCLCQAAHVGRQLPQWHLPTPGVVVDAPTRQMPAVPPKAQPVASPVPPPSTVLAPPAPPRHGRHSIEAMAARAAKTAQR